MKVFTSQQMREMEAKAIQEGCSEDAFMEAAGKGIAEEVKTYATKHSLKGPILLLCAKGNNSGDAYVAGRFLLSIGFHVEALQPVSIEDSSPLCHKNYLKFIKAGGKVVQSITELSKDGIILDGLFGTGFKGSLKEPFSQIVQWANASKLPILSIDIPSGLNGDNGIAEGDVIQANETLYLGAPKRGFFINKGWECVGTLHPIDFGLPKKWINQTPSDLILLDASFIQPLIPHIKRTWHKYERGYVTGLGGSPDMPGAAILSSWAALTAGAGIVRLIHTEGMEAELSSAPIELVRQTYSSDELKSVITSMDASTASFIGPGMGRTEDAANTLKYVLETLNRPCVIDADALSLIAALKIKIPKDAVLTPHQGEMLRLLEAKEKLPIEELLTQAQNFSHAHSITLVLKGAPTFIFSPGHPIYINSRGDPGMATAGSGDVLTGIIAALLAQHLKPLAAAQLGVYLHALAGEHAAEAKTSHCVLASDLIKHLPDVYKKLTST